MACKTGDELKEKYAEVTLSWGRYVKSLEGVPGSYEHQRQKDRLERETNVARIAYEDHKERCHDCR